MPHLMCALGLLVGAAASDWTSISEKAGRAATVAVQPIQEARGRLERAILAPQVSSVDLLIVAIADEAVEEIRFAAPERWRTSEGKCALTESELAAVRARLGHVASAGHAAALGRFEIVLRPGEQLGLSTHRPVMIAQAKASGEVDIRKAFVSTLPTLKLDRLDLFGQLLTLTVDLSVRSNTGNETFARSLLHMDPLEARAGESFLVIVKNPFPIDQRAAEKEGFELLSLDHQHRLLIMTPRREPWPKSKKQIARERELPQLAK